MYIMFHFDMRNLSHHHTVSEESKMRDKMGTYFSIYTYNIISTYLFLCFLDTYHSASTWFIFFFFYLSRKVSIYSCPCIIHFLLYLYLHGFLTYSLTHHWHPPPHHRADGYDGGWLLEDDSGARLWRGGDADQPGGDGESEVCQVLARGWRTQDLWKYYHLPGQGEGVLRWGSRQLHLTLPSTETSTHIFILVVNILCFLLHVVLCNWRRYKTSLWKI